MVGLPLWPVVARLAVSTGALALLAGCGGAPPSVATTQAPQAPPTSGSGLASAPASGAPVSVSDLCGLIGEDVVSDTMGGAFEAGATQTAMGSTTCTFTADSGDTVVLSTTPGFSSLSSWQFQMETLGMTSADAVPGIGEAAYAKAELPFGEPGAQFSTFVAGTAVSVQISSDAGPAALLQAATTLGRTLFENLP